MSDRAIVALGVWLLLLVLMGTATVGIAIAFYIGLGAVIAVLATIMFIVARKRANHRHARADHGRA